MSFELISKVNQKYGYVYNRRWRMKFIGLMTIFTLYYWDKTSSAPCLVGHQFFNIWYHNNAMSTKDGWTTEFQFLTSVIYTCVSLDLRYDLKKDAYGHCNKCKTTYCNLIYSFKTHEAKFYIQWQLILTRYTLLKLYLKYSGLTNLNSSNLCWMNV